jgi:NAD(P)H-hydrate epimerase
MPLTGNGALFVRPAGADDATLTVEETREIDRRSIEDYALPGLCLMENAAVGAVMATCDLMGEGDWHAVIAAGGGNNAGDGLAAARGLAALGKRVTVLLLKDPGRLSPDAAANYRLLGDPPAHAAVVDAHASPAVLEQALADCDVVVDALLGTGFSGELAGPLLRAVEMINASSAPAVALDLPSGMSGNEGVIGPAVKAVRTVAFGNRKPGLLAGESIPLTGNVFIAEIGAPGPAAPPLRRGGA